MIKSYHSIPGPKSLPLIGTLWAYLPFIGKYKFDRLHRNGLLKLKEFGPLVREEIIPGVSIVWVFKPEDIEMIYRCEGHYPERRSHLALQKYRLDKPEMYSSGGLLPTNSEEWYRIRRLFQQDLSKKENICVYRTRSDKTIKYFINERIPNHKGDLLPDLSRLFLELIGLVTFDESLNCFSKSELQPDSRTSKFIKATEDINSTLLKTDNGLQLWKYFKTPLYRKLCHSHSYIELVIKEFILKKMNDINKNASTQSSLLEIYLSKDNIDMKDIFGITADLMLAGIDTLAYTTSFMLYQISKNMDKQEKMFNELFKLMSVDDLITEEILLKCFYTKAVMNETFRMNPVSIGIGRILTQNVVLSNYHVPARTIVVTQNQISSRLPEYFLNPDEFIPERWIRDSSNKLSHHPFLVLPFGYGPRTCIARRLAEQNLQLFLINIVRKYKLTWIGEELDCRSVQINKPDKDILIKFEKREF